MIEEFFEKKSYFKNFAQLLVNRKIKIEYGYKAFGKTPKKRLIMLTDCQHASVKHGPKCADYCYTYYEVIVIRI